MVSFNKSTTNQTSGIRKYLIIALLLSITPTTRVARAQDHYYGSSTTSLESSLSWPWWHSIYFHANGSPRYASGFALSTRNTQKRLPVNPPICGPSFGYFQPCWRQMATVRRCVTCEIFPSNREIPNTNASPSPTQLPEIPPAPEDTEVKEKAVEPDVMDDKDVKESEDGQEAKDAEIPEEEFLQPIPSP